MRKKAFPMGIITLMFLALLSNNAFSDIYMKQKQHNEAMKVMGHTIQPAQDMIVESWITSSKMVVMHTKQKTIVDIDKKIITMANHENKTIVSMPLDFSKIMDQKSGDISQEEKAEFQKFMGKTKVTVEETNERKKIGNWNCRKYIQTLEMGMGTVNSEIWATPDIKIDGELYAKYSAGMMALMPGASQNMGTILQEIKKINGVPVYTKQTAHMMGQTINSSVELLEFKEGKAPVNVFDLPTGYKKTEAFE